MKNKFIIAARLLILIGGGGRSKIVQLALLLLFAVFVASSAFAANPVYTYTATTGGSAPATDGAGAWSASSANWLLNNAGTAVNWPNTSATDASIGNGGAGGTITLDTGISCGNLTFNSVSSPYTLSSGTLSLNGNLTANNSATISSGLTLNGGSIWTVAGGNTLTVSSFTRSAGATLVVGSSSVAAASQGTVTCSPTLVNSVVPWAVALSSGTAANDTAAGYNFATVTGGNIVAYTVATSETGTGSWSGIPSGGSGTINYDLSGTGSYSATGLGRNVNTMRFTGTAAATQLSNGNNAGLMTVNGIVNAGGGLFTIGGGSFNLGVQIGASTELVLAAMTAGITINNGIKDNGATASGLTIMGAGGNVVTLSRSGTGANNYNLTYTGPTTIAPGGTLTITGPATLGSGTYSAAIVNNGTFNYNGTAAQTLSGVISGSGALTENSTSTLTLSGANTYTGNTTINGGRLGGNGTISGAVTINSGGGLAPGNGGVGTITVGSLTMNAGATNNFEFSGTANDQTIVTTSGGLVLNGGVFNLYQPGGTTAYTTPGTYNLIQYSGSISGTATSGGNLDSTWTTVGGGNPHVGNPQAGYAYQFGTSGGWLTVTIAVGGTVGSWGVDADGNWSASGNWTGGSVPGANTGSSGDVATFAGVTTTAARNVTLDAAEAVGAITMNQSQSFTIADAGQTLTLDNKGAGAAVTVSAGTANAIGTAVALKDNTTVTVSSGQSLSISGNITNSSGAKTLTLNGAGTNILSGTNSYGPSAGSVGTTLSGGGTLQVGNNSALGAGDLSVSGNNTLLAGASVSLANNIAVGSGTDTVNNNGNNLTLSGVISGGGNLSETGSGTLTLSGNNTYTGNTTVSANAGILILSGANNNGATATTTVNNGATLQLQANNGNTASFTTASTALGTASGKLTVNDGSTLQLRSDTSVTFNGTDSLPGLNTKTITIDVNNITAGTANGAANGGAQNQTLSLTTATTGLGTSGQFNITGGDGYTLAIGPLAAANGTGQTWTFNPTSASVTIASYSSIVTVAANTLALAGTSTGNAVLGAIANGSATAIAVTKSGTSTWTLTGANTYTGATTISAGTLTIGGAGQLGSGAYAGLIPNNGTFTYNSSATQILSGIISGTGALNQNGSGTLTLSGANTYTGTTTVSNGTLLVNGLLGTNFVTIAGGTLGGSGTIGGMVTNQSGGTLAPGAGTNAAGTVLTISTNLTLLAGSTNVMLLSLDNSTNDIVVSGGTITYGGVLTVMTNGADVVNNFTNGQKFTLFVTNGTSGYAGNFTTSNLPPLSSGLVWSNSLLVDGSIEVISNGTVAPPAPMASFSGTPTNIFVTQSVTFTNTSVGSFTNSAWNFGDGNVATNSGVNASNNVTHAYSAAGTYTVILTVTGAGGSSMATNNNYIVVKPLAVLGKPVIVGGTNFIFSGTNGPAGASYSILSSTNVATALASWTPLVTNTFNSDGTYSYTNSFPTNKARFFRLKSPP